MTELAEGAYEHMVTCGLERRLSRLDQDLVQKTLLDPADAHEALGRRNRTTF